MISKLKYRSAGFCRRAESPMSYVGGAVMAKPISRRAGMLRRWDAQGAKSDPRPRVLGASV